ncbi:hypothetical protein MAR_031619 [Mya arenaria]|uniref:Uncharacterized protein n=1 Tax=Mya arenaria TaxID=6604 RepID=A0ABY7F4F4_MYAAR|nr:hypothetical protein MAR_031619 [Mya arenaria]
MFVVHSIVEQNPANKTDSVPAGVLTGGVIGAVVVLVAAAALTGGESAQTEPYEALNSSRMEESDSRDIYTRLFMTGQAAMTERVNPDCSATNMLNDVGGKAAQSKEYETLNATRLKEGDRSDNYRTLLTTGQTGYTDDGNSENISMYNPTISSDPHSYANMKLKI